MLIDVAIIATIQADSIGAAYKDAIRLCQAISEDFDQEGEQVIAVTEYEEDNDGQRMVYLHAENDFETFGLPARQREGYKMTSEIYQSHFEIYPDAAGFRLTFANGYAVSVVWQGATYSSHRDLDYGTAPRNSGSAEVAVFGAGGKFLSEGPQGRDNPIGWQTPDEVAVIFAWAAAQ